MKSQPWRAKSAHKFIQFVGNGELTDCLVRASVAAAGFTDAVAGGTVQIL